MTPEQQRIKIAQACGYTNIHWYEDDQGPRILVGDPPQGKPLRMGYPDSRIPDYLNDLNAMHEAENRLSITQHDAYRMQLWYTCDCSHRTFISSTAAQRAEAFLRTLGLWEEQPQQNGGGA